MNKKDCVTCRYYESRNCVIWAGEENGVCMRFPPSLGGNGYAHPPIVHQGQYCWEWEIKDEA